VWHVPLPWLPRTAQTQTRRRARELHLLGGLGIIVHMVSPVKKSVLVACLSGDKHKGLMRLRRYEWSDADEAFVRADGRDDEFYLRRNGTGTEAYPRPEFKCPKCKKPVVYEH